MTSPIDTAMVLAAGLGTRMRPLTNDRPKALVTVMGKPLIDHVLDTLVESGIKRAVVNVHAFADQLESHLQKRSDIDIVISDERNELLETGGGIVKALPLIGQDPFVCVNIDSVWHAHTGNPLRDMITAFSPEAMDALLMVCHTNDAMGYDGVGDFNIDHKNTLIFRGQNPTAPMVYMGAQILTPGLFADAEVQKGSLHPFWMKAVKDKRFFGHRFQGQWMHVGDPNARTNAETYMQSNCAVE